MKLVNLTCAFTLQFTDCSSITSVPLSATLLPLGSALGYVVAVLLVKRAAAQGVGLWRTAFVSNLAMGLCFAPLWSLGGVPGEAAQWWQPGVCAALFFLGQALTFSALAGDVSLATPVMGLKILFVAAASSVLLEETVLPAWWLAAILSSAAVGLLQTGPRGAAESVSPHALARGQSAGRTIILAALASLVFAVFEVLLQRFTLAWGAGRFLPITFGLVALFSFGLIPFFHAPLRSVPRATWRWLAPGAWLLALQAAGMAYTLGTHGRATVANILYSTRGLWSVLAVGFLGFWLGTGGEQKLPKSVLRRRLAGSGLMLVAVALVLI